MRDALNNDPKVQIGVMAALLLIVGFLMMSRMGGGAEEPAGGQDAAAAVAVPATGATGAEATAGAPPAGVTSAGGGGAAPVAPAAPSGSALPPTTSVSPEALKAGPGLPAPVASAMSSGDAVVLLVVKESAIDDRLVEDSAATLDSRSGVAFFIVPADEIARYSRITQAVGVNRVPALVTVRPKSVSGKAPQAFVSYGFRDSASVIQAVDDALYSGKDNLPYHPG